jgi:hypothetical protein
VPVESKYNVTVVTGQYDGYADPPDRPTNLLAVANAIAGSQLVHIPSMLAPLSAVPASNITTTTNAKGGVTKSYLVPTKTLPLVVLNPRLKAQEASLRKQIDAAYIRNDPKKTPAATLAGPAPAPADSVAPPPANPTPVNADKALDAIKDLPARATATGKAPSAAKLAASGRDGKRPAA